MINQVQQIIMFLNSKFKGRFSLLVVCFIISFGFSQEATTNNETDLEAMVSKISEQLESPILDSTQLYSDLHRSLKLAQSINAKKQLAQSLRNLGIWHKGNSSLDSTEFYLKKAASTYKDSNLYSLEAETYLEMENAYKQKGEYVKAMAEDFKALEIYEQQKDLIGLSRSYTCLCDILYYQEKYAEGADYCQKAIDIQKQLNVPDDLSVSYRYKADNLLLLHRYDEALLNTNSAIKVLKDAGKPERDIAPNYNTRGNIYKYLERYDDAIIEYKKCYELAKANNIGIGIIPALGNIGHVYILQDKHEEALPYILEAIDIMKESGNTQNLSENYMHASDSYAVLGEFEKAFEYERLYSEQRTNNMEQIVEQLETELQIKYETAKKDETIVEQDATITRQRKIQILYIGIALLLAIILFGMYYVINNNRKKRKALVVLNEELALKQKTIEESNVKLQNSITDLKSTQAQLIQSEKMASLGELTAGIAHEIQNPLNFVNNFSEVSYELVDEMNEEITKGDYEEAKEISVDIKQNLEKILHHGNRANDIVKGMLQHSRNNSGEKELTDINKLTDEYLRLAYHGLRAKDKSFNATLETDFDENLGEINIVSQDIGRVVLNLFTNAFYAVNKKQSETASKDYQPTVSVSTLKNKDSIEISIKDNGDGIPKNILDKIFQPFFTTKPTGQGTGLGLSMSYDIITKGHDGELTAETKEGTGTIFKIIIPLNI